MTIEKKTEPNRTILIVGGNRINYPKDCSMPMADLLTVKILLSIVLLIPKAKFITMDVKSFYLNTPLKRYKYIHLKIEDILEDIKQQYKLSEKVICNGWVYVEIRKGMYSSPQQIC